MTELVVQNVDSSSVYIGFDHAVLFMPTTNNSGRSTTLEYTTRMDAAWIQHVMALLDYLEAQADSPSPQVLQSARDLLASLDAWHFFDSASHYGLQVRVLEVYQRLAYHDVDRGAEADIAAWTLDRWLKVLQRYARSVPALKGQ